MLRRYNLSSCAKRFDAVATLIEHKIPVVSIGRTAAVRNYYDDEINQRDEGTSISSKLSEQEHALYLKAVPRLDEYRKKHVSMPDIKTIPKDSLTLPNIGSDDDVALFIRKKRLIYRCLQRGWLEVDLLLGTWASQNVMSLNIDELNEFENFVNSETIDIYNILTLRLDALPEKWTKTAGTSPMGVVERIQTWVKSNPLGKADPETFKAMKESSKLI